MQKKQFIFILASFILTGCSSIPVSNESTGASNKTPTSGALTLGASVAEIGTPTPETNNTATPILELTGDPAMITTNYENALHVEVQLILGTLKLSETAQDISSDQASLLLPMWQALRSMIDAGNDQVMISSQAVQIINTMSLEQISTISAMQLTKDDLISVSQTLGLEMAGGLAGRNQAGNTPGVGGKSTGDQPGSQEKSNTDNQQDLQPERNNASPGINPVLIDAVIEFLEAKTQ